MIHPHQILFPLGLLNGLIGVVYWLLFSIGLIQYPIERHSTAMVGGFFFTFIMGFMLTAIPKFSGTSKASPLEIGIAVLISFSLLLSHVFGLPVQIFFILFFIGQLFLSSFYLGRWKFRPIANLLMVTLGLFSGLIGSFALLFGNLSLGKTLFFYDALTCIILGIGQRIISSLLGRGPQMNIPWPAFILYSFGIVLTIFGIEPHYAQIPKALAVLWVAFHTWKIYSFPKIKGRLPSLVWIATWGFTIGSCMPALFPQLGIHGAHVLFISGFGLITLMVGSRITLAHGGHALTLEYNSNALVGVALFFTLATVTRVSIAFFPAHFNVLILISGTSWVFGVGLWCYVFLPKIIYVVPGKER